MIKTKAVPVQTTVLPNASLQFVGFVESYEKRGEGTGLNTWTLEKGKNATIAFSVKNDGKTTTDKNSLKVVVEIDNKEIGGSDTFIIGEAMAKGGTSYTVAVVLNVKKDAPNGETPVYVKLFMGENLIDSKTLTLRVKIKEPSTNLIVAEKDSDMGYIKSKSSAYNSMSMTVADPGEYMVEVQVFEGGKLLAQNYAPVTVKQKPGPGQPSDIKLMDMNLVVTKIYSDGSGALVDVSPGIYNQGGDSGALAIEVTARVDQYTQYTRSDDIGIVKGSESRRGKVTFDIPRNREYSFIVSIIEGGKTVMSAKVNAKIKLMEVKYNTLMTYSLVEEGKPVAAAATQKEPGFEAIFAIAGLLAVAFLVLRQRK